ncbi:MAG: DNA replication/repair protein RecF [Bacilli bacterium]|nr:DNA replication/repair protein RecF [Bacilli bacterium]
MILTHLSLRNFRSYESLELDFSDKLNLITGDNGAGKTNLAEAVYYLALAKPWRNGDDAALIKEGAEAAYIAADILEDGISRKIEIYITRKGKKASINGSPIRKLSELSKLVNVILFSPSDVSLFKGPPSARRGFLDLSIAKLSDEYLRCLSRHEKILEERNALLKNENVDKAYLEVLTNQLIEIGEPIERDRRRYVEGLNKILSEIASGLYGRKREVFVAFRPFVKSGDYKEEARKLYAKSLENDLYRKTTGVGLQREDFSVNLDGKDIAIYGSQGENRLAAIALKTAPYFLVREEGRKPIAVYDDVYSELDEVRTRSLTDLLLRLGQCFISAAQIQIPAATRFEVAGNKAIRRN